MSDRFVAEAKELLRAHLRKQPSTIALLADITEIPDDHPAVVTIAVKLREQANG